MKNISYISLSIFLLFSFSACGGNGTTKPKETNTSRPLQSTVQKVEIGDTPEQDPAQATPSTLTPDEETTPSENTPTKEQEHLPEKIDTQPDPVITSDITQIQQALLNVHNKARADVGISDTLTWSDSVAIDAQSYADTLAQSGAWEHDPKNYSGYTNGPYGENLYTSYNSTGHIPTLAEATESWIDEKNFYHYGVIGDTATCDAGKICGHYTQVIWKNTTEVGCAISRYQRGFYKDWYLIVCKYKTPGNFRGQTPY